MLRHGCKLRAELRCASLSLTPRLQPGVFGGGPLPAVSTASPLPEKLLKQFGIPPTPSHRAEAAVLMRRPRCPVFYEQQLSWVSTQIEITDRDTLAEDVDLPNVVGEVIAGASSNRYRAIFLQHALFENPQLQLNVAGQGV